MPMDDIQIEELARHLGIETIPDSWHADWPAYQSWVFDGRCAGLRWELPLNAAEVFDLPEGCLRPLEELFQAIRANDEFCELANFWHYMVYHLPGGMERNTNIWRIPDEILGYPTRLLSLAAVVSGTDHAVENFRNAGVSDEVAKMTLSYIGYYTRDIMKKRGVWGLESMGWLSNYARANIFRLGRLTFKSGKYALPFKAYRNRVTGELIMICGSNGRYRTDGLADGTNGIHDPDAWSPFFEINGDVVTGCPISANHTAQRDPTTLNLSEWEQVLEPGDPIVEVHVAGGSKLLPEECRDSFGQAVEFFPQYYAFAKFAGFACWSWLLDPGLSKILPPDSNIVQFQHNFHIAPVPSDESQAYDLVFGSSSADPTKITPITRLQQAIKDYVLAGNRMRSAAGFIAWEEAEELGRRNGR